MLSVVSPDAFSQLKDGGSPNTTRPARPNFEPGSLSKRPSRNNQFEFSPTDYEPPRDYYFKGKDEVLSNFYPTKLKIFNRQFGSTEAAYQYCKAVFHEYLDVAEELVYARSGLAAKAISHAVPTDPEWHEIKDEAMRVIISAKIEQCLPFRRFLENHPDTTFIENTDNEYWARGANYNGKNMLGEILMQVREEWTDAEKGKEIGDKRLEEFMRKMQWPEPREREDRRGNWKGGRGYDRERNQGRTGARDGQRNDRQTDRDWRGQGGRNRGTDRSENGDNNRQRERRDQWNIRMTEQNASSGQILDREGQADKSYRPKPDDTKNETNQEEPFPEDTHEFKSHDEPDSAVVDHWDFAQSANSQASETRPSYQNETSDQSGGGFGRWDQNEEAPGRDARAGPVKEASANQMDSAASEKTPASKTAKNKKKKEMKKRKKHNQQGGPSGNGGFEITEVTF